MILRGANDSVSNMLPLLQVSPDSSTQDKQLLLFFPSQSLKHIYSSAVNIFPSLSAAIKRLGPSAHCPEHISRGGEGELEAGNAHHSLNYEKGGKKNN